jgi:hypothetical protein
LCIRRADGFVKSPSTTAPTRQKTPGTFFKSSHATDLVEHPELVADRIITFTEIVGTDCDLGGRVHPQIARAKLRPARRRGDREQEVVELN